MGYTADQAPSSRRILYTKYDLAGRRSEIGLKVWRRQKRGVKK